MEFTVGRTKVKFCFAFAATVTVLLIMDGSGICALSLAACIMHECGHLLCMLILGERPEEVKLSYYGVSIRKRSLPQEPGDEILTAVSGPAVNFIAAALLYLFSLRGRGTVINAVYINLCIGGFNMLPCLPLDAGRALFYAFAIRMGEGRAAEVMRRVTLTVLVPLGAAGIIIFLRCGHNFTLIAVTLYILFGLIGEKTVAKH